MVNELSHPVFLFVGLLCFAVLLVGIRVQHGSIFRPIREKLLYRLLLASIAGWLGAWFFSQETLGLFMPGTLFGVLVMLPMLGHPQRHPLRVAVLVWAATIAHVAIWVTGVSLYGVMSGYEPMILGAPAGVAFGVIVFVAMSRILNLRFDRPVWIIAIIISAICGTIYAGVMIDDWLGWVRNLEYFNFEESPIFPAYILWYAATAAVFDLGKPQPQSPIRNYDFGLLVGLVLLTIWFTSVRFWW